MWLTTTARLPKDTKTKIIHKFISWVGFDLLERSILAKFVSKILVWEESYAS